MDEIQLFDDEIRPPGFAIDSLDKANWAIAKIVRAERAIAQRQAVAEAYLDKVRKWLDDANKADISTVDAMTEMLKPWATVEIAKGTGAKHVKLLGGEIGYRQSPASLEVNDEAAAIAWAEENCTEAVKIEKRLIKTPLKKLIMENGECPPGVEVKPGDIKWYVKTDPGAIEAK